MIEEKLDPPRRHRAVAAEPTHAHGAGTSLGVLAAVGDDGVDALGIAWTEGDLEAVGVHLELPGKHVDAAAELGL